MNKRDAPEWTQWERKARDAFPHKVDISTPELFEAHKASRRERAARTAEKGFDLTPIYLRDTGLLRRVEDQGVCGSCYAFAGTHAVQDDYQLKNGHQVESASIQHVLECCSNCHAYASGYCDGGYPNRVANFLSQHGAPTDSCKRYKNENTEKAFECTKCDDGSEPDRHDFGHYSGPSAAYVEYMKHELDYGGVLLTSMYCPSDWPSFMDAHPTGVYPIGSKTPGSHRGTIGGHAVEIVGWNVKDGRDYWIIKNSWSPGWGESGFFKWDIEDSRAFGVIKDVVITSNYGKKRQDGGSDVLALYGSDENRGGLMDIDNDEEVQQAAHFAVAEISDTCDGESYELEKVLDTQVQPTLGFMYHIYLQASTPSKLGMVECTAQYHAHVVVSPSGDYDLYDFRSLDPEVGEDLLEVEERVLADDDDDDKSGQDTLLPSVILSFFAMWLALF